MFGQRAYAVYIRSEDEDPLSTAIFVKEGFAPLAFIFTVFWALYYKIWWMAGVCFAFQVGKQFIIEYGALAPHIDMIISTAYMAFIGFQAQDWYCNDLEKRGYSLIGVVLARNLEDAQQRFFDKYIVHTRRHGDNRHDTGGLQLIS